LCVCVCVYIYIYIYIYRHTLRITTETERQTACGQLSVTVCYNRVQSWYVDLLLCESAEWQQVERVRWSYGWDVQGGTDCGDAVIGLYRVELTVVMWLGCTGWNWLRWCCDWVVQGGTDCGDVVIGMYRVELTVVMLRLGCTGWNWLWWCDWAVRGGSE